jgi:hypothetical protein
MAEALGATFLGGSTLRTEIKWTPKAPPKVGQIDLDEPVQDDEPLSSQAAAQHLDQGGDVHGAGNPTTISGEDGDVGKGYLGLIVDLFKPGGERQLKYRDFRRVCDPTSLNAVSCLSLSLSLTHTHTRTHTHTHTHTRPRRHKQLFSLPCCARITTTN